VLQLYGTIQELEVLYRLILSIDYEAQVAYFKYFLTHAEYSKDNWKNDPYY
jgi:mRNA interferase HigB